MQDFTDRRWQQENDNEYSSARIKQCQNTLISIFLKFSIQIQQKTSLVKSNNKERLL